MASASSNTPLDFNVFDAHPAERYAIDVAAAPGVTSGEFQEASGLKFPALTSAIMRSSSRRAGAS
eukprot:2422666-Amphidinium_carterae.1